MTASTTAERLTAAENRYDAMCRDESADAAEVLNVTDALHDAQAAAATAAALRDALLSRHRTDYRAALRAAATAEHITESESESLRHAITAEHLAPARRAPSEIASYAILLMAELA